MKKILSFALVIAGAFLFASPVFAQFTTVTATVQDPNGIPYGNGTMSAVLVPSAPGGFRLSGQPYSGRVGPLTLDSTGKFTANFGDVTLITPSAQWQITVNSNQGGIAPPLGTGGQTFVFTSSGTTISGTSPVNISASLNALAPKLTNITVGSGSVTSVSGTAPIVATPNPIIGTGSISCPTCTTGSGASPQVAFWSSPSVLTGTTSFTWADGTNALGVFQGPATSTLSTNLQGAVTGTPESLTNYHVTSGGGATAASGQLALLQSDKDIPFTGLNVVVDATNLPSQAMTGSEVDAFINVPMAQTNTANQAASAASVQSYGAGTSTTQAAYIGENANNGSGTVTNSYDFWALTESPAPTGPVTNFFGFEASDMLNVGSALNAAFHADAQTAGANNWGFFSVSTNKDHFGSLFSGTDNTTAGSLTVSNGAANAHTIFSSAATTTNTIAGFATVPTTGHAVTCTSVATTCTLTDGGVLGTVTSIATTAPITGGTITSTGTIACATCVTSAASLANGGVVLGTAGTQASGTNTQLTFSAPTLTVGLAGTSTGILALTGATSGTATVTAPAVAGTNTNPFSFSNIFLIPVGATATPSYSFTGNATSGLFFDANIGPAFSAGNSESVGISSNGPQLANNGVLKWSSGVINNASTDTGLSRDSAGVVDVGTGASGSVAGTIKSGKYATGTNCSSSASPAVCGSSAAGSVALPTNAVSSSIQVNTTAVTANSQIFAFTDDTLGTKLGVTCNSTVATLVGGLTISARTAGTSFTIANNVAVVTNPLCVSYLIVN